jgi:hypothetical protein
MFDIDDFCEFLKYELGSHDILSCDYFGAIIIETYDVNTLEAYLHDNKIDYRYKTLFKGTVHNFHIYPKGIKETRFDKGINGDQYYPYFEDDYAEYHFTKIGV